MISLRNVTKSYRIFRGGGKTVLNNISVNFPSDRNIGVLGLNGAGKSTLIKILSGSELPDTGSVIRNGSVSFPLGFASIFHPDLTGKENVEFVGKVYGCNRRSLIEAVSEFAEIGDYLNAPVKFYSSGMLAKLAFGLCLEVDFDTYLIDEITEVGDGIFRKKAAAAFRERMDRSNIILVSHNVDTIKEYCDMCAILDGGKVTMFDSLTEGLVTFRLLTEERSHG